MQLAIFLTAGFSLSTAQVSFMSATITMTTDSGMANQKVKGRIPPVRTSMIVQRKGSIGSGHDSGLRK
jgi:hypothetical protein